MAKHQKETDDAIAGDATGDGFIFDMFKSELYNHEYSYTRSIDDALDALCITVEDIEKDARLKHGLQKAMRACR